VLNGFVKPGVIFINLTTGKDVAFIDSPDSQRAYNELQVTPDGTRLLAINRGIPNISAFGLYSTINLTTRTIVSTITMSNSTTKAWVIPGQVVLTPAVAANKPPVANAGPDQVVSTQTGCTASVKLDGTGSSDPDNDKLV